MATTNKTEAPMDRMRTTALAAGLLYIATFVFSIPAHFGFYDGVLNDPDFVLGAGNATNVLWGALGEVITALTCIGTAVVLYPVTKRYSETAGLGFVTSRVLEAAMIFVGIVSVLAVYTLRQDAGAADPGALSLAAQSLVAVKDWTFLLGPGVMAGVNALCLGSVLYRSGLVPRAIPALGLIGAPLILASGIGTLFGLHEQVSSSAMLLMLPIGIWELSVGVWMAVKGFKATALTDEVAPGSPVGDVRGVAA